MSKKIAKLQEAAKTAIDGVTDENILVALTTLATGFGGTTTEDAKEVDTSAAKGEKTYNLSELKPKKLTLLAEHAGIKKFDKLSKEELLDALGELKVSKLEKAAAAADVTLPEADDSAED